MSTMPERLAALEANFAALVQRMDRQIQSDDRVHRELMGVIRALQDDTRARDRRDQRIIGAAAAFILFANIIGPIIAPVVERLLMALT